jgi:hypothetical protein
VLSLLERTANVVLHEEVTEGRLIAAGAVVHDGAGFEITPVGRAVLVEARQAGRLPKAD